MINPKETLHRKSASKTELRQALAQALNLPCPTWATAKPNLYTNCRNQFTNLYENHTGTAYSWQAKDAGCLQNIIKKLYAIAKNTDDNQIIHGFEYLINQLPQWYVQHGLSLCVINAKFNEIIAEIKNHGTHKKTNISDQYKKQILDDLRT